MSFQGVQAALDAAVSAGEVAGAVALVTDRRGVLHEAAAGLASTTLGLPMRVDTGFYVASMTKPVTSIALLMLHEAGKLDLDDALAAHLPGFEQPGVLVSLDEHGDAHVLRPAGRAITIRDLLTHTSGFGSWFLDREVLVALKGRVEHFTAPFLMHDPGERFSYGNSTDIVGLLIEPLSGLPLERFFEERITAPLGMRDSGFDPPADPARIARIHQREGGALRDAPEEIRRERPRGGGGMYSTARDYGALLRMLLNDGRADDGTQLLSPASVEIMTTNQIGELSARTMRTVWPERTLDFAFLDGTQKFGFNLMIETQAKPGGRAAGSWGWAGIFNTFFWGDPLAGIGAVLLMQMSPFCEPACLRLLDEFETAVYSALA